MGGWHMAKAVGGSTAGRGLDAGEAFVSTDEHPAFERHLRAYCEGVIADCADRDLAVSLVLTVEGTWPATHAPVVLRVVDELLCNAIEHGLYMRQSGQVAIHVANRSGVGIEVVASDDGWGFERGPVLDGNGFGLLRLLGEVSVAGAKSPFPRGACVAVLIPLRHCVFRYLSEGSVGRGAWSGM